MYIFCLNSPKVFKMERVFFFEMTVALCVFILALLKCEQVWKRIVPLRFHTSVILCKADLHILSRLALGTELIAMSASSWVLCIVVSPQWWLMNFMVGFYTLWWSYQVIIINMSPVVLCRMLWHLSCDGCWNGTLYILFEGKVEWSCSFNNKKILLLSFAPLLFCCCHLFVHSGILKPTRTVFILNLKVLCHVA